MKYADREKKTRKRNRSILNSRHEERGNKDELEGKIVERLIGKEESGRFIHTSYAYDPDADKLLLKKLKENIERSEKLTENVLGVLDGFIEKVDKSSSNLKMVYGQIKEWELRYNRIDESLRLFNEVIYFNNTPTECFAVIDDSIAHVGLNNYLMAVDRVLDSNDFFKGKDYKGVSNVVDFLKKMKEKATNKLELKFTELLHAHRKLISFKDMEGDLPEFISFIDSKDHNDLTAVMLRLDRLKEKTFIQKYIETRTIFLKNCILNELGIDLTLTISTFKFVDLHLQREKVDTEVELSELKDILIEKTGKRILTDSSYFIFFLKSTLTLLTSENILNSSTIPAKDKYAQIFQEISAPFIELIIYLGTRLVVKNMKKPLSVNGIATLLDTYLEKDLFSVLSSLVKSSELHHYRKTVGQAISDSLVNFREAIINSTLKPLPDDGIVHEITSRAILYINHLFKYKKYVNKKLEAMEMFKSEISALGTFINSVIQALKTNLHEKSKKGKEEYVCIFRLNNYFFIYKEVVNSEIQHLLTPDMVKEYEHWYLEEKQNYFTTWHSAIEYLDENYKGGKNFYLKERFNGFTQEFLLKIEKQQHLSISDAELQDRMRRELSMLLVPQYATFVNTYENYASKLDPETLEQMCLKSFFTGKLKESKGKFNLKKLKDLIT